MWSPSSLFISNRFYRTQNNFGPSNDHMITEFSWVVTMATDRAQYWHLAVTCNISVAIVKTIVIVAYLPYQITSNQLKGFVIQTNCEDDTNRLLSLYSDAILCVMWIIYRSHRRAGHGTNFLTAVTYSRESNSKLYVQKNNYAPTPQSNLPIVSYHRSYKA